MSDFMFRLLWNQINNLFLAPGWACLYNVRLACYLHSVLISVPVWVAVKDILVWFDKSNIEKLIWWVKNISLPCNKFNVSELTFISLSQISPSTGNKRSYLIAPGPILNLCRHVSHSFPQSLLSPLWNSQQSLESSGDLSEVLGELEQEFDLSSRCNTYWWYSWRCPQQRWRLFVQDI